MNKLLKNKHGLKGGVKGTKFVRNTATNQTQKPHAKKSK